ncbi:tetratricopeptide repeat protein [Streptomyces brevispora]|uniref:tetratricopeptide repeat protein n=1 Tax=Streptomyces brevispora TaxID=887462 RepID=UPI0035DAD1C4
MSNEIPNKESRQSTNRSEFGSQANASERRSVAAGNDISGVVQTGDRSQAYVLKLDTGVAPDAVDARAGLNNISARTDTFVSREVELKRLDAAVVTPGRALVQSVHGLGGIGKSSLVAHWASSRDHGCYPIRWINAETVADIERGLAEFATDLAPVLTGFLPEEAKAKWALQWLATHAGWLIILDNVNKPSEIDFLLARAPKGRFLITSRSATGWRGIETVALDVLSEMEAVDLFTCIASSMGPRDLQGAAELCSEFGYLPLAVEQAAAYLSQDPFITPIEYLSFLAQYPSNMYRQSAETAEEGRTIAQIWQVTMDKMTVKLPLAGHLLRALAWYAPEAIPSVVPAALLDGYAEPPEVSAALGLLCAYSMIKPDTSTRTYSVHRLVQAFFRSVDPEDPHRTPDLVERAGNLATHLHSALPESVDTPEDLATWQALIPHLDYIFDRQPPDTNDTVQCLHHAGLRLIDQDKPRHAILYIEKALAGAERGVRDEIGIQLLRHSLACAYSVARDDRAIPLYEQVLERRRELLGENDAETLVTESNLSCLYIEIGDFDRGISGLLRVLEIRESAFGEFAPQTLDARHNLACAYRDMGKLDVAISMLEQIVAVAERDLGEDYAAITTYRHNLANLHMAAGGPAQAIPMLQRALQISMRVHGEFSHSAALAQNSLALAYQETGRRDLAASILKDALESVVRVLDEGHPHIDIIRHNLQGAIHQSVPGESGV